MTQEISTKRIGDLKGVFHIPSYQRGYRWGEKEIIRLLEDINSSRIGSRDNSYYLQPVTVQDKGNEEFELIDGQQRLTTLWIILEYCRSSVPVFKVDFSVEYDNKPDVFEYLSNICKTDLINDEKKNNSADTYFIHNAMKCIKDWFEEAWQECKYTSVLTFIIDFFQYVTEHVKVIWYSVDKNEDVNLLFSRLNIGKIPLTNAELVKAMLMCRKSSEALEQRIQDEIAYQWDNIEKELHNEELWYFLTDSTRSSYQTRIDLVLDLISEKKKDERDGYYTFFKFSVEILPANSNDPYEVWKKIQHTFLILKDWFEDHWFYHIIGYLIETGTCELSNIYKLSNGREKTDFRDELIRLVIESVTLQDGKKYSDLSYENKEDYEAIKRLLILFNIESVRQMSDSEGKPLQRFPFYRFSESGEKTSGEWTLEHIHAQQSDNLRKAEEWKEWLRQHARSIRTVFGDKEEELAGKMERLGAAENAQISKEQFDKLAARAVEKLSKGDSKEYIHTFSNLALLTRSQNAALNNSTFDVKRRLIMEKVRKGMYVPFCTQMVFMKLYGETDDMQIHFWSHEDRMKYIGSINEVLKDYLGNNLIVLSDDDSDTIDKEAEADA